MEGKPIVIMKQMHDLYTKMYMEKHQAHTHVESLSNYQINTLEDVENRMHEYIDRNFDGLDKVNLPEGDEDAAWDKMFDAYKEKTHQTND